MKMNFKTYIKTYPVTWTLIALILAVFVLMLLFSGSRFMEALAGDALGQNALFAWGANSLLGILQGEFWRLLTCIFLHVGFLHLLFNVFALISVGVLAETIFRKTRYIVLFLLSGIGAALASAASGLMMHQATVSAGASGSLFGLLGAIIVYAWNDPRFRSSGIVSSLAVLVLINLALGFSMAYIDNAGHIGGLISGMVIGGVYRVIRSIKNKGQHSRQDPQSRQEQQFQQDQQNQQNQQNQQEPGETDQG